MLGGPESKYTGVGAAIVFFPPFISLIVFGKSRGMYEALQIGANITFSLMIIAALVGLFILVAKMIKALRTKE